MGVEGYSSEQMERLKDYKIAFDQEAMWAEMQKKKKRRGAFFFITMALVALAIVFFGYLFMDSQKGELEENNNQWSSINNIENKKITTSEKPQIEIATNIDDSDVTGRNENEVDGSLIAKNNALTGSQSDSKSGSVKSSNDTRELLDDNNTNYLDNRSTQNDRESQNQSSSKGNLANNEQTDPVSRTQGDVSNVTNITVPSNQIEKVKNIPNAEISDNNININKISILDVSFLESLRNVKLNLDHLNAVPVVIPPMIKPLRNYKWFVGAYGGIGYANKSLDSTIVTDTNDKTLEEVSVGLELKYQIRPSLYVSTGLEYWHVTERRSKDVKSSIESINEEIRSLYDLEESAEGFLVLTTKSFKHTMYQTLNVPLMVGYNTTNEHFNIFAEVGALYNFSVFSRGDVPDYQREFFIGSRQQISPQLGLGISYRWTNGFELFSRANWRGNQHVTRMADGEFGAQEKYSAIRGQIGLRIGF